MTEPENLVLQQLREIRAALDELTHTVNNVLTRLTGIERLLITMYGKITEDEQRIVRLEARIERLEEKLVK